jgi:transcriptional regulator of nitric oxide reductase
MHARVAGKPLTVAAATEAEDGTPRRTRTKMSRGPLIIRVAPRQPEDWREASGQGRMAALKTVRREKALPDADADAEAAARAEAADIDDEGWQPASSTRRYGIQ